MLYHQLLVLLFTIISSFALVPIGQDRFIQTDSYKVASIQEAPQGFVTYLELLKTSGSSSSSKSKDSYLSKSQNSTSKGSTNENSTVLNLIPGISTLQTDENNECWFVNTTIGKNQFPLIIDTGSAYLWVYGNDCTDEACQDRALYTPTSTQSSTSTSTSTFELAYVTGTASGEVVEDNIIVNKLATTEKFKFGKAETVPNFFKNYPVSGIFGLPSNDSSAIQSIISALYESHAISLEKFSISLGSVSNQSDYANAGIFAIGDPIKELYQGDVHYSDLIENDSHYWLIEIDSISIDSYSINFTNSVNLENGKGNSSTSRKAIVDSGTTVLVLPKQDALDLHSYFKNSITDGTNFAIYCNSTLNIDLNINGQNWTIPPELYLGSKYPETSQLNGYCVSNFQGIDSAADDSWILGAVFLKSVYAVFDVNNQKIGFATKNTDVLLASTSTSSSGSSSTIKSPSSTAAYYGNSSSVTTSLSSHSSSASSSKSYKDAAMVNYSSSIFTIMTTFFAMLLL